tara:strand:+ start:1491 stop:1877 length:387 start_codon:yes stop_codon:yes gene_type:complete
MTKDEVLKLALEALETSTDWNVNSTGKQLKSMQAITALRTALAQPEPIVMTKTWFKGGKVVTQNLTAKDVYKEPAPLPVQPARQPLTDEEIKDCLDAADQMYCERDGDKELFKVRAVLAAHNIGGATK